MGSLRTYTSAMCWLPTAECQQTPSETFCARRPHCALSPEREKQQVRALQAVAAVRSANANLGPHHSGDLPSSLENFQNYVTFKFNQEIDDEATDVFPRCFVSFMQENLEEKLMVLTHMHKQACGGLVSDRCNSLLLLFCAA